MRLQANPPPAETAEEQRRLHDHERETLPRRANGCSSTTSASPRTRRVDRYDLSVEQLRCHGVASRAHVDGSGRDRAVDAPVVPGRPRRARSTLRARETQPGGARARCPARWPPCTVLKLSHPLKGQPPGAVPTAGAMRGSDRLVRGHTPQHRDLVGLERGDADRQGPSPRSALIPLVHPHTPTFPHRPMCVAPSADAGQFG